MQLRKVNPKIEDVKMDENEQLKNVIRQWSWEIMKRLELPLIEIEFNFLYPNCTYKQNENFLLYGLKFLKEFKDINRYAEAVPPMKFFDRLYFIVAHETAHYLQKYRYPRWFGKYFEEWRTNVVDINSHVRQKLERNASRIASILLKEYKNKT